MSGPETYEVFAIRYGSVAGRLRRDNFIIAPDHPTDPHDGEMPLDYFVWAIVNENRTIVVDTGFDAAEAARCSALTDMLAQLLWRCVGPHL